MNIIYILKLPIHILIAGIFGILSYFFKKENILLFGSFSGNKFVGNNRFLFLRATSLPDYKAYWITKNTNVYNELMAKGLPVVHKYSIRAFLLIFKARFIFIDVGTSDVFPSYMFGLGNFKIVQSWHGTSIKRIGLRDKSNWLHHLEIYMESRRYHLLLATSESNKQLMSNSFASKNIIVTGLPRNDIFHDESLLSSDVIGRYGLQKYSKIFLYAPTFRDNQIIKPFSDETLEQINKYLSDNGFLLIFKLHMSDKSIVLNDKYSHILSIDKSCDLQEILYYTDTLITDYSSTFIDYMITGRPIIFYPYDYKNYLDNCRDLEINYFEDLPGPFALTEADLFKKIKSIDEWFKDDSYISKYNTCNDYYNTYKDSQSTERIFRLLTIN